jgi:hypothetical protein
MGYHINDFMTFVKNIHNDEKNARIPTQTNNIRLKQLSRDRHILCGTDNVC